MVISAPETITDAPVNKTSAVISNGAIPNGALSKTMTVQKLPSGKYTLVSVDIDTTGRRLIDEIVQLAAYSPKAHFEQYIMPYMNLNPAARQRHQVRVISIGFYRMLKSMQTYKIIKSKSEIAALKDFLDWLEELKAKDANSLGVILLYHEERKFIPYMILQALKKYNLLDRFLNTVTAFANSNILAQQKLIKEPAPRQPYTLRRLSRFINTKFAEKLINNNNNNINNNNGNIDNATGETEKTAPQVIPRVCGGGSGTDAFDGNASVRARLTYEIAHYLCNLEQGNALDTPIGYELLLSAIYEQAQPIEADLQELKTQNENVDRQNSFRPVFFPYFKATLFHRVRAVKFRIVLAEHGFDLNSLQAIWENSAHDGILSSLQTVEVFKPEERHELADLFDSYFDPKKAVIGPVVKNNRRRNRRSSATPRNNGVNNNEGNNSARQAEPGAGGDKRSANSVTAAGQLPDSTTKSPIRSNGYNKSSRGNKRFNQRVRNGVRPQRYQQQHVTTQTAVPNNPVAVAQLPQLPQRVAVVN